MSFRGGLRSKPVTTRRTPCTRERAQRSTLPLLPVKDGTLLRILREALVNEDGATLVEYALIVSLVAVACIGVVTALSGNIQTSFNTIGNALGNA